MKYKITKQRILFNGGDIITKDNKVNSIEIDCDRYQKNYTETEVNEDNIDSFKNLGYSIGDIYKSTIKSIDFYSKDEIISSHNIFADPYYILEEYIKGKWDIIDKHRCSNHK